MELSSAFTWIAQNANALGPAAILMLVIAIALYGFGSERVVLGKLYRQTCTERDLERTGHTTARDALAETKTELAVAKEQAAELQRNLARCEGSREWLAGQLGGQQPPPAKPRRKGATP